MSRPRYSGTLGRSWPVSGVGRGHNRWLSAPADTPPVSAFSKNGPRQHDSARHVDIRRQSAGKSEQMTESEATVALNKQDRTVSRAARTVLALKDEDLEAAIVAVTEASTHGGIGGLRDLCLALGQMAADRMTEEAAAKLVASCLDAEEARQ